MDKHSFKKKPMRHFRTIAIFFDFCICYK